MRFNKGSTAWLLLLPLLVLLSGCFQQAGESFQPVNTGSGSVTIPQETPTPLVDNSGGQQTVPESSPTPIDNTIDTNPQPTPEVAITVFSPTREELPTNTPEFLPTQDFGAGGGLATATSETQFVTPFSPLGPLPTDTLAFIPVETQGGISTATPSGLITPTALPGADNAADCTHTIQPGETLFRIAVKNNLTVAQLLEANPQVGNGNLIHPGDVLNIPDCNATGSVAGATSAPDNSAPPVTGETYIVARGDTLFAIAQRFGVTMKAIQDANNISNPNQLSVGQQLIIPPPSG